LTRPRVLHVDTFSAANAQSNVKGMTAAYTKVATHLPYDYRLATNYGREAMNNELRQIARKFNPDLVHLGKCESVRGDAIKYIKQWVGATVIHFYGDYRAKLQLFVVDIGRHADWTLLQHADPYQMRCYKDAGCNQVGTWLAGTDPAVFHPYPLAKEYDVIFMANFSTIHASLGADRGAFLKDLISAGISVDLFGNGWSNRIPDLLIHPYVATDDFARACSQARIALNYSTTQAYLYTSWPRVFNTMASGCFFATRYFPGLETLFENGKHLVWFDTHDEAISLIKYYLSHDAAREKIALAGRQQVLSAHTWDNRIAQMIGYINA